MSNTVLSTRQLLKRINGSRTYEDSYTDCLELMKRLGISNGFLATVNDKKTCSYNEGMFISKAFDIYNMKPKMCWLPSEIKQLYLKTEEEGKFILNP